MVCSHFRRVFSCDRGMIGWPAETYFNCAQLTTWAETVPAGWGVRRPKSDDFQVKSDSVELVEYELRRAG